MSLYIFILVFRVWLINVLFEPGLSILLTDREYVQYLLHTARYSQRFICFSESCRIQDQKLDKQWLCNCLRLHNKLLSYWQRLDKRQLYCYLRIPKLRLCNSLRLFKTWLGNCLRSPNLIIYLSQICYNQIVR